MIKIFIIYKMNNQNNDDSKMAHQKALLIAIQKSFGETLRNNPLPILPLHQMFVKYIFHLFRVAEINTNDQSLNDVIQATGHYQVILKDPLQFENF